MTDMDMNFQLEHASIILTYVHNSHCYSLHMACILNLHHRYNLWNLKKSASVQIWTKCLSKKAFNLNIYHQKLLSCQQKSCISKSSSYTYLESRFHQIRHETSNEGFIYPTQGYKTDFRHPESSQLRIDKQAEDIKYSKCKPLKDVMLRV